MSKLIKKLKKQYNIQHSDSIKKLFNHSITYEYLEDFAQTVKNLGEKIAMISIPKGHSVEFARLELNIGFDVFHHSIDTPIPFISHQFPKKYKEKCPHGDSYLDCYFFFFTKHITFLESEDYVIYYLERINKLKAFL